MDLTTISSHRTLWPSSDRKRNKAEGPFSDSCGIHRRPEQNVYTKYISILIVWLVESSKNELRMGWSPLVVKRPFIRNAHADLPPFLRRHFSSSNGTGTGAHMATRYSPLFKSYQFCGDEFWFKLPYESTKMMRKGTNVYIIGNSESIRIRTAPPPQGGASEWKNDNWFSKSLVDK